MAPTDEHQVIRLLVVARHPFRVDDLALDAETDIDAVELIRRPGEIELAIEQTAPDVVLIDTGFPEGHGLEAIETTRALAPDAAVLALTPTPPPYDDVARATRAGASGFIDVDADPRQFREAATTVAGGGAWFPDDDMRPILAAVASDLDSTDSERRSRLTGILLGLIPLAGLLAALMAYLWRKYLSQIGVRPVDIAIDPASRVVDAITGLLLALGVFGPLLFVGTWLDLLRGSRLDRGPITWLLDRPKFAHLVLSAIVLGTTWIVAIGTELLLVAVVGPIVGIAAIARAVNTSEELPRFLRIKVRPKRVLVGGFVALFVVLGALGGEVLLLGPNLGPRGAGGVFVPRALGFSAQPMLVYEVDTDNEPRELLYLGGNADLYALVDPCNDDEVEFVSVGAHRLVVIDEVTCPTPDEP